MSNFNAMSAPEYGARTSLCETGTNKVFEFEGTLFSTGPLQGQSSRITFQDLGSDITLSPEFVASFKGKSDEQIYGMIFEGDEERVALAVKTRTRHLIKLAQGLDRPGSLLLPGVDGVVRILRQTGQRAGIASASPDEFVGEILRKTEVDGRVISDVFPEEKSCGSSTVRNASPNFAKPRPFSLMVASWGGMQGPNSALQYIGDSRVDVQSIVDFPGEITGIIASQNCQTLKAESNNPPNIVFVQNLGHIATSA